MTNESIKIAFVTDDGITISSHFGRAHFYEIVTLENGRIVHRERREKYGHHTFSSTEERHEHGHTEHGFDDASRRKHDSMIAAIVDCQILVARGMGEGAFHHLKDANITPILTDLKEIQPTLQEYIKNGLINHAELLH
ncbi:MAG: dinitrogenase iron-molybdenum cofactor biosynthesis protein [Bacteroidetes bacterium]|nr:dinitrogenase iron-molybdenum cofactor biosynthesis protein [Bacteroidota bacterium]MCW5897527.1 dinitrogenase iron-molybdenum cofactor biosynthesis protein [Bacteroidota bacterium]